MSNIDNLEKARRVRETKYLFRMAKKLRDRTLSPGVERLTLAETIKRIRGTAALENVSIRAAAEGLARTRAFTSEADNYLYQVRTHLTQAQRNEIRKIIANKTGRSYKTIKFSEGLTYDPQLQAAVDRDQSVAIYLTKHKTGESMDEDFIKIRELN